MGKVEVKGSRSRSILTDKEKRCFLTGRREGLDRHHIFHGTALRKISDRHGFWCYIWQPYHIAGLGGLHAHPNCGVDLELKIICQRKFEERHSREEFMTIIGRNYLDKEEEIPVKNKDGFWRLKDTWEFDGECWE